MVKNMCRCIPSMFEARWKLVGQDSEKYFLSVVWCQLFRCHLEEKVMTRKKFLKMTLQDRFSESLRATTRAGRMRVMWIVK